MGGHLAGFRRNLRSGVAASAAPYGYTITIWSSGAVGMDLLGKPHVGEALLYVAGAVAAFLAVEMLAYGQLRVRLSAGPAPRVGVWGHAHLASAGGAVVAVWGSDHAFRGELGGWPVAGFLATGVYLLLNALQTTLASDAYAGGEPTGAPEL
jgi:hypothetical protein